MIDSTKIEEKIKEIENMISIKDAFYALWDLMQEGVEIDIDVYYDPAIMGAKVKIIDYVTPVEKPSEIVIREPNKEEK